MNLSYDKVRQAFTEYPDNEIDSKMVDIAMKSFSFAWNEQQAEIDKLKIALSNCADCGLPYADFGIDTTLPNLQWKELTPDGAGLLCANCICKRAAKMPNVLAARMVIEVMWSATEGMIRFTWKGDK